MCGACGSEAQRTRAATRHQGRSQQGGAKFLGSKILGFLDIFIIRFINLCHGAYSCTHNPANMPKPFFNMHLHFSNSCVCVSKHVYALSSSLIRIHISRHIHLYGLCSVLHLPPSFSFFSFSPTNSIDTYVTVPIHVRVNMLICLSSLSICIFISLIPSYVCLNMYTHCPSLPYSYTSLAIFICMVCVLFYTYNYLFVFFFFSTNLIDTFVTVPIDVLIALLICLSSLSICIFISLIPAYVYLNMYMHCPSLSYSYTFLAIFICMVCVLFYICNHLFFPPFFLTNLIDSYVTVPIDVLMTLLISLPSASFCLYIFVIHAYVCVTDLVYALPSSFIFIHIYGHIYMYLC